MPSVTRITYGDRPQQFGDLYLPDGPDMSATVVLIHGGFWRAQYALDLMVPLAEDLLSAGYAVWNIEYRRVAQPAVAWCRTMRTGLTAWCSRPAIRGTSSRQRKATAARMNGFKRPSLAPA